MKGAMEESKLLIAGLSGLITHVAVRNSHCHNETFKQNLKGNQLCDCVVARASLKPRCGSIFFLHTLRNLKDISVADIQ